MLYVLEKKSESVGFLRGRWWLEQAKSSRGFQFSKLQEFYTSSICLSIVAQMKGTLHVQHGTVFFKHNIMYSSQLVCLFVCLKMLLYSHNNTLAS
jgi:hypothetical protein